MGATPIACCADILKSEKPASQRHLATLGTTPVQTTIALAPGHDWLIEAREQGNDATVEVRDSMGRLTAEADHPERRTGTRRMVIAQRDSQPLTLTVTGKEHAAAAGTVEILVFDLGAFSECASCVQAYRSLAAADGDYALGQKISLGRIAPGTQTARDAYERAAAEYLAAETLLDAPSDTLLRGQTALALAGLRYFDLQDWRGSAEWAGKAEKLLARGDPYRQARAEALAAAAWIEMATDSALKPAAGTGASSGSEPKQLLDSARRTLRRLFFFHMRRHERYDAALQMNNIGLAYYYGTQFPECIAAAHSASAMFARLREAPRQGLAWQNSALCHWGLGHLPEALAAFNLALEDLRPQPYPQLYLLTLNNTALINFALGHLDESLRLHDRALELAIRTQNRREEAQSLYGIGVTYYALGDLAEAREFLERSLVIRSASLDGRGRRATLRSLATVYADRGEYSKAMALDREALSLAPAPISRAASRLQLAVHTALDGNPPQALQMLAELIGSTDITDPLLRAQARLQRAVIERRSGIYEAALRDLVLAGPVFRRIGTVPDEFAADLERARVLQLTGSSTNALEAVGGALRRSADIRRQTANPELRAQLQLPLRPAHDLQLDLLWEQFEAAMKAGRESEARRIAGLAFRSADAARAHSFADIAAQQYSPAVRRDLAGDWARRERLYQSLAGLRFALDARVDRSGSADPRAIQLSGEIAGLQRQVDTLNNAIAARTSSRRTVDTMAPVAGSPSRNSEGDPRPLPADAAIIAYWLGDQSAYCWTVTPQGIHWVRLTDPAALTDAARAFHDALSRLGDLPREQRVKTAAALYAQIVRPVEQWIGAYRRWFFIPDGALDYVPFAALRADTQTDSDNVIVAHDVALAPAAWMLLAPVRRAGPADRGDRILLVSDPIYELSDPRLPPERAAGTVGTAADTGPLNPDDVHPWKPVYRRIPGTAREASGIEAQFPARDVDTLRGLQATRERLLQLDWSQYRFIHIASHGHLDARMPQLSALILSGYDERGVRIADALRAADLSSLTLNAEVAVFSGCDTALGKDVLNEGMVGISYAALARGAGAVVSSLWPVPDEIGANLMTEFYRHLLRDSTNPAAALSASMRSVLERNPSADPALWAAFQVSVVSVGESAHRQGRAAPAAPSTTDNKGPP